MFAQAHQKEKQQWNESMTTLSREKEITVKKVNGVSKTEGLSIMGGILLRRRRQCISIESPKSKRIVVDFWRR